MEANGGLNQQRSAVITPSFFTIPIDFISPVCPNLLFLFDCLQICNAVAVAGLLNAVLVIPEFEFHAIWKDSR